MFLLLLNQILNCGEELFVWFLIHIINKFKHKMFMTLDKLLQIAFRGSETFSVICYAIVINVGF